MKYLFIFLLAITNNLFSQKDYSNQWQDLYSYNNVKDFTIVGNKIFAISENAMFIHDFTTENTEKFSSINGLSTAKTSTIFYDEVSENIIIGYESGLIELVSETGNVTPITGVDSSIFDKEVNGIYRNKDIVYACGKFGIIELNIDKVEIGDKYTMSSAGGSTEVHRITASNDVLYAATGNKLLSIDISDTSILNPALLSDWSEITTGNITNLLTVNDDVYFSKGSNVYEVNNPSISIISSSETVLSLEINQQDTELVVTTSSLVEVYETGGFTKTNQIDLLSAINYSITTNKAMIFDDNLYVNTTDSGILTTPLSDKLNYTEIHPDGPRRNDVYTVSVSGNQKWIVYGGQSIGYNGLHRYRGIDYFDGTKWEHINNASLGSVKDFTKIIVDPKNENRVFIGSYHTGVLELENGIFTTKWNDTNTGNIIPDHRSDAAQNWVSDLIVDNNNNIWTANARGKNNQLFSMYDGDKNGGEWVRSITYPDLDNEAQKKNSGLNKMFVDHNNNIFVGTRKNGVLVFNANEEGGEITNLNVKSNKGALISEEVFSVVSDENEKVWIGTSLGLVVFNDYKNLFENNKQAASKVIIEENGNGKEFLGNAKINDIIIDLAGNKWFAVEGQGVFQTSSNGQTTYNIFNTSNSPLPSNKVIDLELDKETGLIYMVTDKGTLSYDAKNEPFSETVTEVIAYPNPAIRSQVGHEQITIVAKDGNGMPNGANVKIIDVSGRLVYEVNISKTEQSYGGKVVWDKTNLRGIPVVSGIYIVLVSSPDGLETTTTKIAIVN